MEQDIKKAIEIVKQGGIVIFPTDTAFGIGCRIDDERAIKRLFEIRKRPESQATPVLVDTVKMARDYIQSIPQEVIDQLVEPFWPGALTIVLSCKTGKVSKLVRGGGDTIGVRIPNHPVTRSLIRGIGIPILGPSANFHGEETPYKAGDLNPELIKLVDYVIPGECSVCQQSTVIDCSRKPWKILRQGAINISNIKDQISKTKMDIVLSIDTSSNEEIVVGLEIDGKKHVFKKEIGPQKAQIVLPMVQELLNKHSLNIKDLNGIKVKTGPGSFTGLRVGISIANAFSYALNIPINNQKTGELIFPEY